MAILKNFNVKRVILYFCFQHNSRACVVLVAEVRNCSVSSHESEIRDTAVREQVQTVDSSCIYSVAGTSQRALCVCVTEPVM